MKISTDRALAFFCITVFMLYWIILFFFALPDSIVKPFDKYKTFGMRGFAMSWKLFSPPQIYNDRMYIVLKKKGAVAGNDTLEVLEKVFKAKQKNAPFNVRENIADHLISNTIWKLKNIVYPDRKVDDINYKKYDSAYVAQAIAKVENFPLYKIHLSTIQNFCSMVLTQTNVDTTGREMKIIITERPIQPFTPTLILPKEAIVFETSFKPFQQ